MTNCIKKYAGLIAVERGTLLLLILVFLFLGARDYESMYSSNLIALAIASTFGVLLMIDLSEGFGVTERILQIFLLDS